MQPAAAGMRPQLPPLRLPQREARPSTPEYCGSEDGSSASSVSSWCPTPRSEAGSLRPSTPRERVAAQIVLNQAKRLQRLAQACFVVLPIPHLAPILCLYCGARLISEFTLHRMPWDCMACAVRRLPHDRVWRVWVVC
jgi:hypothetical protein